MKKKTPEQEVEALCKSIRQEIDHWKNINQYGCSDQFYADGTNMNLTRNHIIYAKRQISEICEQCGLPIPDEMYLPTPPEVSEYYMSHLRDKERVARVAFGCPERITTKRIKYDTEQLSLF